MHRNLREWSDPPRPFAHLWDLPQPLLGRVWPSTSGRSASPLKLSPLTTFQATPILRRGVRFGNFFLAQKEGGKHFADADEEMLVLTASRAVTAIGSVRTNWHSKTLCRWASWSSSEDRPTRWPAAVQLALSPNCR